MSTNSTTYKAISFKEITINQSDVNPIPMPYTITSPTEITLIHLGDNKLNIIAKSIIPLFDINVLGYEYENKILSGISLFQKEIPPSKNGGKKYDYNGSIQIEMIHIDGDLLAVEITAGYTETISQPSIQSNPTTINQKQTLYSLIVKKVHC